MIRSVSDDIVAEEDAFDLKFRSHFMCNEAVRRCDEQNGCVAI